ncbi:hypothetical protein [Lacipirellula sp.]|uniref:hypothetical protein n=1 Tax=Lacipirellula sp. TaxID=2691419 RepID=UPI003D0CE2B6
MSLDLTSDEIEQLIEALDCLKTKFAFVKKGGSYAERTTKLLEAETLEQKLRAALGKA